MKKIFWLFLCFYVFLGVVNSARLYVSPYQWVVSWCNFKLDIYVDTSWQDIKTSDLVLVNNWTYKLISYEKWEIFGFYSRIMKNKVRYWSFKWKKSFYVMGSNLWNNVFSWKWKVLSLNLKPLKEKVIVNFYMIPWFNWDDSSISILSWWKIVDILTDINTGIFFIPDNIFKTCDSIKKISIDEKSWFNYPINNKKIYSKLNSLYKKWVYKKYELVFINVIWKQDKFFIKKKTFIDIFIDFFHKTIFSIKKIFR